MCKWQFLTYFTLIHSGFLVPTGAGAVTTTVAAGWCVGGLEACRRFSTIWHLSRAFTQANTLSTAGQPSFDKSVSTHPPSFSLFTHLSRAHLQWCEERMRLSCSEYKEFSNLIGPQSLAAQISLV